MKKILFVIFAILVSLIVQSSLAAPTLKNNIRGISDALLDNVTTRLSLKQNALAQLTPETIKSFYQEAPNEIRQALQPFGYFKASVKSALSHKGETWQAYYTIILGPPLRITQIDLQLLGAGASDPSFLQAIKAFPLQPGEVLQTDKYNAAKQFLFVQAANYGYVAALLLEKKIVIDLEHYTTVIILHFDTGPKYFFGAINFSPSPFSRKFLLRFMPFASGDLYSTEKIRELQDALTNSNLFQQVTVSPEIAEHDQREVPVTVDLVARKARQYNFGVGFGTDTGPRGSASLELRHLTQNGQSFKGLLQASTVQNALELHYLIPGYHPANDLFDFSVAGQSLNLDLGKSITEQIAAGYITVIQGWHQTLKLSLQHEHYQLTDQPSEGSTLLIPSVNWLHSKSDDPVRPSEGHNTNIIFQGASKYLFATGNFAQGQIDMKYITPLFHDWLQLFLHAALGYTAINDINNLPLSLQFYTGGTKSVRGYGYNTIGPGKNLVVGSIELRRKIIGDWYIAAFFDAGNANNDLMAELFKGVGAGVVWRTSIGSLELTFAKALTLPGTPGRIQFSMGPEL